MKDTYTKKEVINKQIIAFLFGVFFGMLIMGSYFAYKAEKERELKSKMEKVAEHR
ncbi:hypothetical protein [Flagellimonas sp.]|uniref:hypothetical protein n=1 Tax=Flagellimonas sp. TaxID=2058762 RepID=UPI003F49EC5F